MNYHPLAVAGGIGAVFAVPLMVVKWIGGWGVGHILEAGGMVLLLVGMVVLIVLWVVETVRARR